MKFYLIAILIITVLVGGYTLTGQFVGKGENMKNTEASTGLNRFANFETNMGNFKIELFDDKAPITAGNFVQLVQQGFYNDTKFHRVIKNFMIQGGDPLTKDNSQSNLWGTGGPGYEIPDEFGDGLKNVQGTISMANHGPNTGGSQFFINVVDNSHLDGKHAVFGKVVEGYDVVEKISKVKTVPGDKPLQPVVIKRVTITDK